MRAIAIVLLSLAVVQPAWAQTAAKKAQNAPQAAEKNAAKAKTAKAPAKKADDAAKGAAKKAPKAKARAKQPPKPNPAIAIYAAMPADERMAIQGNLLWTGDYNGTADGDFGEASITAVKAFQARNGGKQTGLLTPPERAALAAAGNAARDEVGWRLVDDPATGIRLGLPSKLVPNAVRFPNGHRWSSVRGEVQVETFRVSGPGTTLAEAFEKQKSEPANRQTSYSVMRDGFFVVSGLQGLKKFYVRAHGKDHEIRGVTILYDQAMEGTLGPIVVAMSSTFGPFPTSQFPGPPKVEYGTGIVVDRDGYLITSRTATEDCYAISVGGLGRAERIADDAAADLALLRVYGVHPLTPASAGNSPPNEGEITLAGIADPRLQNGAAVVSKPRARLNAPGGSARGIEPTPAVGFSGAAALDATGRLIGMSVLKPSVVAGPPIAASRAEFVSVEVIRRFLSANGVTLGPPGTSSSEATKAIHRVICVRK